MRTPRLRKTRPALFVLSLLSCPSVSSAQPDAFYVLQHDDVTVADLTAAGFEWLILEPTVDGGAAGDLSALQVQQIRTAGPCPKTALAYLSIGEAEDYRDYWDPAWVDANGDPIPGVAPDWLGPANPDFAGNYKVRYWDPDWQALMFGTPAGPDKTPLDRILDQGFDGVYLDIIDAYEFWSGPEGGFELTRMAARSLMIDFVEAIATYARVTRNHPELLVFPQNAAEIIRDDDGDLDAESDRYFAAVSGIGREDLFYDELTPQPPGEIAFSLLDLREFALRGKTVIVTDYCIYAGNPAPGPNSPRVADFHDGCRDEGFIPYAAYSDRDLNEIVVLESPPWSVAQPDAGCSGPVPLPCMAPAAVALTSVLLLLFGRWRLPGSRRPDQPRS